jgi:glycosyltransferase involved in cell wall biosynthesis
VIVNHNAGRLLTECVQSVLAERARHVFVVDNDSHDDSLAHLSATISDVRVTVIRNGKNLGFALACNIGARASSADTLLFLNPDSVLAEGGLRRMTDVLESDSSIGMVGGLLCNPDGSEQPGGAESFPRPGARSCGRSACRTWASGSPPCSLTFCSIGSRYRLLPPQSRSFLEPVCSSSAKHWKMLGCGTKVISCIAKTWIGACGFG